jgi:hypothetical protein
VSLGKIKHYFDFVRRPETRRIAAALPSIARGTIQALEWRSPADQAIAEWQKIEQDIQRVPNPLEQYFRAITEGRGIWKWEHYWSIYHRHLHKFVGRPIHIVEVGIYSGGSLAMWKSYFGRECKIFGVDIEPACQAYQDDDTKIFIGDQADRTFWQMFKAQVPRVDILIDDGGHLPEQQIVTLEEMLPHVRPGGVYICEDVHSTNNRFAAYIHGLTDALNASTQLAGPDLAFSPSPFQKAISSIHAYPFVIVIEKIEHPIEKFVANKRGTEWQPFL